MIESFCELLKAAAPFLGAAAELLQDKLINPIPIPENPPEGAGAVEPYPQIDEVIGGDSEIDEVIGGDSVRSIQRRLLAKYPDPSTEIIEIARLDAQDFFEIKVRVITKMAQWDPTGDWMGRGARALDNPRTASGEPSLKSLLILLMISIIPNFCCHSGASTSMHESSLDILWIASWDGQTIYDRARLRTKGASLIGNERMAEGRKLLEGRGTEIRQDATHQRPL